MEFKINKCKLMHVGSGGTSFSALFLSNHHNSYIAET